MAEQHSKVNGDGATAPTRMKCEIKTWHARYKKDGSQEKVAVDESDRLERPTEEYALVVNRTFDIKHHLESTKLSINSPFVLKALRDVVESHPAVPSDFSEPFEMESPFQMLFHFWDDLETYKTKLGDDEARMHLNVLLHFMNSDMGEEKRRMTAQINGGSIDFLRSWALFRPRSKVLIEIKSHPWMLTVEKTGYGESLVEGKFLEIHCLYSDWDGTSFGDARKVVKIFQKLHFPQGNAARITDLPVVPYSHFPKDQTLPARLRQRGEYFFSLCSVSVREYDGVAEYLKEAPPDFFHPGEEDAWLVWLSYYEKGRVIVDRKTFQEEHYQPTVTKNLRANLDAALCPPFVMGYSCGGKRWCRFFLPALREVSWNPRAFDDLVLPSSQKRLLQALVSSHHFPDDARYQAEQKGKGLVCLLHGPPGSGKTLTAECSAELTKRALFSTSMSELNQYNSPWHFEYRLAQVLRLATAWRAIVLLDEADVFLEARQDESSDAAERNALVAVFLRNLEYFSGIVFLTTNRIHVFDAAMKSRVHMALGYSAPDQEPRRQIWKQNLLRLGDKERGFTVEDGLERFAAEALNGREIANTINTACTLARYSEEPLQLDHIAEVLGVRRDFEHSLRRMRASAMSSSSKHGTVGAPMLRQGSILSEEPEGIDDH